MLEHFLTLLLCLGAGFQEDADAKPIPGVGPVGKVVQLHTGFKFTEGPAADAHGNVYFSDIPNNRVHRTDSKGELSTFIDNSDACNGLMLDRQGRLLACQGKRKRLIAIDTRTKQITSLADTWNDRSLGTPNDLVIDGQGGVYFTAPDTQSVYYVDARGTVVQLLEKQPRPNGVILAPDEKTLYVLPSGSAEVMAYPVSAPGKIGAGKVLCTLIPNPKQPGRPGGDGLTVDTRGNLYLTRPSMKLIQVVAPDGKTLGALHLPEEPSNCTFGGADMKTLYVTAQTSLYTMKMEATGHRFAAPPSGPLPEAWDYVRPMKKIASRFRGQDGVVIHVGGSMTIANPFGTWPRSGKGKTPEDQAILQWMHTDRKDKTDGWWLCRTEIEHYRAYTSESGLKAAMLFAGGKRGLPTLEKILDEYKPRMVTIECGIYDVEDGVALDDYRKDMGKALDLILERGAIPILNTIPPFKAQLDRTRQFNDALRALAKERGVPIIDLEREILTRRPDDWFGTLMDRIHLTAGKAGGSPGAEPTAENLRRSGYLLRGWLTVRKIAEIKQRVLDDAPAERLPQDPNTWLKRSPRKDGPPSPGLSYETSLGYDPVARRVIRWGGHAQGGVKGSGEQIAELWTLDPATMKWELKEPNRSPPASCCVQQNVFDTAQNRFLRFKAAGGNHGWQWYREIYLNNTSLWNYDLARNTWRDMRPLPEPPISLLHSASWDSEHQVAVVFGGEGTQEGTLVYDPYVNTWSWMHAANEPVQGSRESRSGGNLAYDAARKLHILFGSQFTDDPHAWGYDLRKNAWRDLKPATLPPTNRNDAVLAYDSLNQVIVAVVRVAAGDENEGGKAHLETWAYDAGKNNWARLKVAREPDPVGGRSRVMTYVPDQNFFLIDGYVKPADRVAEVEREHQIWTYRFAESGPDPLPRAPANVQVVTTADSATLKWQASPTPDVTDYVIYRGEGTQPWLVEDRLVGRVPKTTTTYRDTGLKPGTVYFYGVRAVGKDGRESADRGKVRTQPRVVEDAVVSVISAKEVRLSWEPPAGHTEIAGYHVERAVVEVFSEDEIQRLKKDTPPLTEPSVGAIKAIGAFRRLSRELVKTTGYTDTALDLTQPQTIEGKPLTRTARFRGDQLDAKGKPYRYAVHAYRLRAVNALGVESGPSPYFLTIPSAPQHLFSREEGESCHLKWAANPELGLKGYRIYWMKGPRPEGAGQATHRLTAEPIKETRHTDGQAGKEPRRFWVVAVDALGQEGIPSSPTWHYRTQRSFYVPFVGDWHQ